MDHLKRESTGDKALSLNTGDPILTSGTIYGVLNTAGVISEYKIASKPRAPLHLSIK